MASVDDEFGVRSSGCRLSSGRRSAASWQLGGRWALSRGVGAAVFTWEPALVDGKRHRRGLNRCPPRHGLKTFAHPRSMRWTPSHNALGNRCDRHRDRPGLVTFFASWPLLKSSRGYCRSVTEAIAGIAIVEVPIIAFLVAFWKLLRRPIEVHSVSPNATVGSDGERELSPLLEAFCAAAEFNVAVVTFVVLVVVIVFGDRPSNAVVERTDRVRRSLGEDGKLCRLVVVEGEGEEVPISAG